jgi:hypothetical protein
VSTFPDHALAPALDRPATDGCKPGLRFLGGNAIPRLDFRWLLNPYKKHLLPVLKFYLVVDSVAAAARFGTT